MSASLVDWALPQLSRLLPLDPDSLRQIVTYTASLSKRDAADHLRNLLGDSPQAHEFTAAFNTRSSPAQPAVSGSNDHDRVPGPQHSKKAKKPRPNIHTLPARQIDGQGDVRGAYRRDESTLQTSSPRKQGPASRPLASNLALRDGLDAVKKPVTAPAPAQHLNAAIIDPPRSHSPAITASSTKTKVTITGGTAMHGASTVLDDLDSAIRSLELQTNPTLTTSSSSSSTAEALAARDCNCMATRHPLLAIAPNCTRCGKVICIKQGLGPCTFCHSPLLSTTEISNVLRVLKDERGRERQSANNAAHKRAEVATKPRAFTGREFLNATRASPNPSLGGHGVGAVGTPQSQDEEGLTNAKSHRDKLLAFQAQNARRTRIHDEAADYDLPDAGTNMWASPQERAQQLKRQQRAMREMEEANRPEWERRKRQVMSMDVVGGKVVRRMMDAPGVAGPPTNAEGHGDDDDHGIENDLPKQERDAEQSGGAFSRNPLLGALIRPVISASGSNSRGREEKAPRSQTWRRVQDDFTDNEDVILDGGIYGRGDKGQRALGDEEGPLPWGRM